MSSFKLCNKEYEFRTYSIDQLENLLIDPEAQRKLEKSRARGISDYAEAGINGDIANVFFAPWVANLRTDGVLSVNDGQHRTAGLKILFEKLMTKSTSLRGKLSKRTLTPEQMEELNEEKRSVDYAIRKLKEWKIPMMVYLGLSLEEERQLFHDLNNFGKKPPKSLSLEFDTADMYTRLAKEIVQEVKGFKDNVEWGQKLSKGSSKHLFSNIHAVTLKVLGKSRKDAINEQNYDDKKEIAKNFFEIYFKTLPKDYATDPERYIYNLASTLQGIGQYANYLIQLQGTKNVDWAKTFENTLSSFDMSHEQPLFVTVGKVPVTETGKLAFRGSASAIKAISETLKAVTKYVGLNGEQIFIMEEQDVQDEDELSDEETQLKEDVINDMKGEGDSDINETPNEVDGGSSNGENNEEVAPKSTPKKKTKPTSKASAKLDDATKVDNESSPASADDASDEKVDKANPLEAVDNFKL